MHGLNVNTVILKAWHGHANETGLQLNNRLHCAFIYIEQINIFCRRRQKQANNQTVIYDYIEVPSRVNIWENPASMRSKPHDYEQPCITIKPDDSNIEQDEG